MSIADDIATFTERLTLVRTAIDAVLLGQEYNIDGKRVRRADLEDLITLEKRYESKLSALEASSAGSNRMYARRGIE